jgi:hypothetical protein
MLMCVVIQSGAKVTCGLIINKALRDIADILHLYEAVCPGFREGLSQGACQRGRKTN